MKPRERIELLKDLIQQAVDRGAQSVEQVHQSIADLPFEALEKTGLLQAYAQPLREKQKASIGMVYGAIRRINQQLGQLISDQFENLEDGEEIAETMKARPTRKTQARKAAVRRPRKKSG